MGLFLKLFLEAGVTPNENTFKSNKPQHRMLSARSKSQKEQNHVDEV